MVPVFVNSTGLARFLYKTLEPFRGFTPVDRGKKLSITTAVLGRGLFTGVKESHPATGAGKLCRAYRGGNLSGGNALGVGDGAVRPIESVGSMGLGAKVSLQFARCTFKSAISKGLYTEGMVVLLIVILIYNPFITVVSPNRALE